MNILDCEVGKRVRCTDASHSQGRLEFGKTYTITSCCGDVEAPGGGFVRVKGVDYDYWSSRFEPVEQPHAELKAFPGIKRTVSLSVASYEVTGDENGITIHDKEDGSDLMVSHTVLPELIALLRAAEKEFTGR